METEMVTIVLKLCMWTRAETVFQQPANEKPAPETGTGSTVRVTGTDQLVSSLPV